MTLFAYLNVSILIKETQNAFPPSLKNVRLNWIRKDNLEVFLENNCQCHLPETFLTNEDGGFIIRKNYDY